MTVDDLIKHVAAGKIEAYAVAFRGGDFDWRRSEYTVLTSPQAGRIARRAVHLDGTFSSLSYALLIFESAPADSAGSMSDPYEILSRDNRVIVFAGLGPAHIRRLKMRRVA